MQTNKIIVGDAVDILRNMETGICDMCVTSLPYYGLRDYETPGQIGLETSPEEYIERLVEVFREVHRVLKDDGTLWINIGDSYATRSGAQLRLTQETGVATQLKLYLPVTKPKT